MNIPPELQRYAYVFDDAPGAVEAIVRYCASLVVPNDTAESGMSEVFVHRMHIKRTFGLDQTVEKLDKGA